MDKLQLISKDITLTKLRQNPKPSKPGQLSATPALGLGSAGLLIIFSVLK